MRVLLLNPPGEKTYIRDYFCSKTTKSNYLFHPIDLVVLSGTLAEHHEVAVLDCMAERLTPREAEARIAAFAPDAIVSLVGSVSWIEDRAFLARQAALGRRVAAMGDVLQEDSDRRLEQEPWLEAALHVFSNDDVLHWLEGRIDQVREMTVRPPRGRPQRVRSRVRQKGIYRVPRPRHELFPSRGYHFSFARNPRFATLLSDYGCPFRCSFCVIGTLGFQMRPIPDVLEEIDHLRARGIKELFFQDQTFGVVPGRALELLEALAERGDLSFTCFTRPDTADDELFAALAKAGCHTVMMGVENADEKILRRYRKVYTPGTVRAGFERARRHGLRRVGTFVLGLPEETEQSLRATLDLAIDLELDFMSLNVAVPRFSTPFRRRAVDLGLCDPEDLVMDQAGERAFLPTRTLDREQVIRLKREMIRRFYLRPGYLARRLTSARSLWELRAQAREGLALLRRNA